MPTLEQLSGNSTNVTNTSTSIASGGQALRNEKYVVGENLASDLLTSMKVDNASWKQAMDVTEDIATRIGVDKSTELALFIEEKKKSVNPNNPMELRKMQEEIANEQTRLSKQVFILPNAQEAFDKTYTVPTAISTAKLTTNLELEALKIDDETVKSSTLNGVRIQMDNGMQPTKEQVRVGKETMSAYEGEGSIEKNEFRIATEFTTSFNAKTIENPNAVLQAAGYDAANGFDTETAKRVWNNNFSAWGELTDDGAIAFNNDVKNMAREEILRTWTSYYDNMTNDGGRPFNERFKSNYKSAGNEKSTVTSEYIPSATQAENLKTFDTEADAARTEMPTTKSDEQTYRNTRNDLINNITETTVIEQDMSIGVRAANGTISYNAEKADAVRGYMDDGKTVTYIDAHTKKKITTKISGDDYTKAYDTMSNNHSSALMGMDMSKDGADVAFMQGLENLGQFEVIGQKASVITQKYSPVLDSKTAMPSFTPNEINQYLAYERFRGVNDKSRQNDAFFFNTLRTSLAQLDPEDKDYKKKYATVFSNAMKTEKNTRQSRMLSAATNTEITAAVADLSTGDGRWDIMFNSDPSMGAEVAFKQWAVNTGKVGNIQGAMKDIDIIDYGTATPTTIGGTPDLRVFAPTGLGVEPTVDALDTIRKNYNKQNFTDFDAGDIILENQYDSVSGNFKIIMRDKKNTNVIMGTVTARNGRVLLEKGKDL